jgi:hypothetical protein
LSVISVPHGATILYPSGAVDTAALPLDDQQRLDTLMQLVGGYVQAVPLPGARYMLVNEDGKATAHIVNQAATDIALDVESIGRDGYIAGVAVIVPQKALS